MIFPPTTCQRLIVKVGSALLVTPEGEVRREWLTGLVADIAARAKGLFDALRDKTRNQG